MKETLAVPQCLQFNFKSYMKPLVKRPERILWLLSAIAMLLSSSGLGQTQTNVILAWSPSPVSSIAGYNVYSGGVSATYTNMIALGNVTNTLITGLNPGSTYFFSVTAVDTTGLESPYSNETSYSVPANIVSGSSNTPPVLTNTAPTISGVANQTISINTTLGPVAFLIGDGQTPASNLVVTVSSSNPSLVPGSNIVLQGSSAVRTITVTPVAGQAGSATIALTVCDPALCATTNFVLTVVPLPTLTITSPGNGANYTAPATISLGASCAANGHTITAVQFYNGTTLLGQVSGAPYTFTWSNVGAGSYQITAQALYDAGSTVSSGAGVGVTVTASQGLPLPWQAADVGAVGVSGNAASTNGTFTVQGAGNINGMADNFRFVYQNLSSDGEIRAQIYSAQNTGGGDLTGVMIRESLTSGSKYALMGFSPGGTLRWQRRSNTGSGTSNTKAGNGAPPNLWVRIVRKSNTLTGYKSTDGVNWTQVNSATITMASNIYIGLAVASGSTSTLATSVFSNLTVVP